MSGFCGLMQEHSPIDSLLLKNAGKNTPPGAGRGRQFLDGYVGLGFRQSKIAEQISDRHPLSNENKNLWLVCDGQIYNHAALRKILSRGP